MAGKRSWNGLRHCGNCRNFQRLGCIQWWQQPREPLCQHGLA
jgi:hypothetical protein